MNYPSTRYRASDRITACGDGHVVLYINGREYTRKAYKSKKQRTDYIARWFEEFDCSIEIGIIPKMLTT
jgi:hypothetical protein